MVWLSSAAWLSVWHSRRLCSILPPVQRNVRACAGCLAMLLRRFKLGPTLEKRMSVQLRAESCGVQNQGLQLQSPNSRNSFSPKKCELSSFLRRRLSQASNTLATCFPEPFPGQPPEACYVMAWRNARLRVILALKTRVPQPVYFIFCF